MNVVCAVAEKYDREPIARVHDAIFFKRKLGVDLQGVLDLNAVFHERGYRKDMGVRGAVALMFNRRFLKSRKATTSNWANLHLTPAQLSYAANDAYAALRVYQALGLGG